MCSNFLSFLSRQLHGFTRTNFYFVVRFRVVFYFDWLWHLQSDVRVPFTSFIYFYSLRSLSVHTVRTHAFSVYAHTVVSLIDVNVTAEVCLPILLCCCVHWVALCTRRAIEVEIFCGGKRHCMSCAEKRQAAAKWCDRCTIDDQLCTFRNKSHFWGAARKFSECFGEPVRCSH